jgi:hypothetical protein
MNWIVYIFVFKDIIGIKNEDYKVLFCLRSNEV